jgi:hypothetical protein
VYVIAHNDPKFSSSGVNAGDQNGLFIKTEVSYQRPRAKITSLADNAIADVG